jgi:hypothetical protein
VQKREQDITLEGPFIMGKANELAQAMGIEDFKATLGWLDKFKKRNGIRSFKLHGEARSADMAGVALAKEKLPGCPV